MKKFSKIFWYIALIGLILELIIHIISLTGFYLGDKVPQIAFIPIAGFIVFIFAIIQSRHRPTLKESNMDFSMLFQNIPKTVAIYFIVIFLYMPVNFLMTLIASGNGVPEIIDGKYVLFSHGYILKELTEAEFLKLLANYIRMESSMYMALYALSAWILWPPKEQPVQESTPVEK